MNYSDCWNCQENDNLTDNDTTTTTFTRSTAEAPDDSDSDCWDCNDTSDYPNVSDTVGNNGDCWDCNDTSDDTEVSDTGGNREEGEAALDVQRAPSVSHVLSTASPLKRRPSTSLTPSIQESLEAETSDVSDVSDEPWRDAGEDADSPSDAQIFHSSPSLSLLSIPKKSLLATTAITTTTLSRHLRASAVNRGD